MSVARRLAWRRFSSDQARPRLGMCRLPTKQGSYGHMCRRQDNCQLAAAHVATLAK